MKRLTSTILGLLGLGLMPATASAAQCLHAPVTLPGLSGPPVWHGAPGGTDWRPQLHDPRWAGAPVRLFTHSQSGVGALYNGQYRVLLSGNKLYVSIQVISDADIGAGDSTDTVYLGLTQGSGGNNAWVVAINPNRGASVLPPDAAVPKDPGLPVATGASFINWYQNTNIVTTPTSWSPHPGNRPPWIEDSVRTWNNSPGVSWAVTFIVDLTTLGLDGTFQMFVGARVGNGAGTTVRLGNSSVVLEGSSIDSDTILPTTVTSWVEYDDPGSACSTGVTLSPSNVGVWNGSSLTNEIQACGAVGTPCSTPGTTTNQFRVNVGNVPNAIGPSDFAVRTNIRIADWGSTISNWKFAPWKSIAGLSPTVFTDAEASLTNPPWDWNFASGATHGTATTDFTCAVQPGDGYCPKLANADNYGHQCMLVEIAAGPSFQSSLDVQTAAVYRNMEFQDLSTLSRQAKITIEGMQALTGQAADRDVYLHVQALNMPAHGNEPMWLPASKMAEARRYADQPPILPQRDVKKPGDKRLDPKKVPAKPPAPLGKPAAPPKPGDKAAIDAAAQPAQPQPAAQQVPSNPKVDVLDVPVMSPEQALEAVWPTYKIYPYVDTGKTTTIKGKPYKVLDPMVPFGFYLEHDGPLYGFTHALEALGGVTITQVAENYYKLTVKNESFVEVKTTVTAEEKPKGPTGGGTTPCPACPPKGHRCQCDVPGAPVGGSGWLAALFAATVLRARRRKSRS